MERKTEGLGVLAFALLRMIDAGVTVPIDDVYAHIQSGDAIDWIVSLGGQWEADWQFLGLAAEDMLSRHALDDFFVRFSSADRDEFLVEHNGLCLLLAFCIVEQRNLSAGPADEELTP